MMAKEPEKERDDKAAAHQVEMQAAEGFTAQLPASFAAMLERATPETVAGWLQQYPTLRDPILFPTQELRGNAFAQTVLAIGPGGAPEQAGEQEVAASNEPGPAVISAAPASDADAAKDAERRKVAAWNQVSRGGVSDAQYAPSAVRLPASVVSDLERLWQKSITGKEKNLEHGGNLVRTYGGREHIREQPATSEDEFVGDPNEKGVGDTILAIAHTHPEPDAPEHYSCFSVEDIQNFMEPGGNQRPMKLLRSGPMTYMLVHTKQSRATMDGLLDEQQRLDGERKKSMMVDMKVVYDAAFKATPGNDGGPDPHAPEDHPDRHLKGPRWAEAGEAAVAAVCAKYEIAFYKGRGSELQRVA
jgi:hypothetical protein